MLSVHRVCNRYGIVGGGEPYLNRVFSDRSLFREYVSVLVFQRTRTGRFDDPDENHYVLIVISTTYNCMLSDSYVVGNVVCGRNARVAEFEHVRLFT